MKLMRLLAPGVPALLMSIGVTVGALYVTISAAVSDTVRLPETSPAVEAAVVALEPVAPLNDSTVRLTDDNHLIGRLSTIDSPSGELVPSADVTVNLIPLKGPELSVSTDFAGVFEFTDVSPGIYTLNARGEMGAISMAVRLIRDYDSVARRIESHQGRAAVPVALALDLQLDAAMASASSLDVIEYLIEAAEVEPDDSEPHQGQISPGNSDDDSDSEGSYLGHTQIRLQPDGSLSGRASLISRETAELMPVNSLAVSFVQDGQVVAATQVETDGSFTQHNLLPGVYSMIVAGSDGVGYIGVDVIGGFAGQKQKSSVIPVSLNTAQNTATIGIVKGAGGEGGGSGDGGDESDGDSGTGAGAEGPPAEPEPSPAGGGPVGGIPNAPGGGVGGGGGFGGGEGLGELLGLAGAALGAAALASDDDSGTGPASPGN